MKWEKSNNKAKENKYYSNSEKKAKDMQNTPTKRRIEPNLFNRISRDSLRKSSLHEEPFEEKKECAMFNTLQQTNAKTISIAPLHYQHKKSPSLSLFMSNSNQKFNNFSLSVKSKDKKGTIDYQTQRQMKFKTEKKITSPDLDTVIPTIEESNTSDYNKILDTPLGNSNAFTAVDPQTPSKVAKSNIFASTNENEDMPDSSIQYKRRNISQTQIKSKALFLSKFSPCKDILSEKNYQIKKYRHLINYHFSNNPKVRDNAGRLIQHWWKRVKTIVNKIIKIQSHWRGYKFKKHLYGIISVTLYYQTFCNKLNEVFKKYVLRKYFPLLHLKKRYLLIRILKIKLRKYYNRWEIKTKKSLLIHKISVRLFILRNANYNSIKSLKAYYHIWVSNTKYTLIIDLKTREFEEQKAKFTSLNNLLMGVNKLINRRSLKIIKQPLVQYLKSKARNRSILIIKRKCNNIQHMLFKHSLFKWKTNSIKLKYHTLFENIKVKRLDNLIKQRHSIDFKCSFDCFKRGLIAELSFKIQNIHSKVIIPTAINHLILFGKKKGLKPILILSKQIKFSKSIIYNINKQLKRHFIRKYLKLVIQRRNKGRLTKRLINHFNSSFIVDKIKLEVKYFNQWKSISQIKELIDNKNKSITLLFKTLQTKVSKSIIITKEVFYHSVEKKVHINTHKKVLIKLGHINKHIIQRNTYNLLNQKLRRLKIAILNMRIQDMKEQFLRNMFKHHQFQIKQQTLAKYFNYWKTLTCLNVLNNEFDNMKKIDKGLSILVQFKKQVIQRAIKKLKKRKITNLKGNKILLLYNNLSQSFILLRLSFTKWRLTMNKETAKNGSVNFIKFSHYQEIQLRRRGTEKAKQMTYQCKCFLKWYYATITDNKHLVNNGIKQLLKGINKLKTTLTVYYLQEAFCQIKLSSVNINNRKLLSLKHIISFKDKQRLIGFWHRYKYNIFSLRRTQFKGKTVDKVYCLINKRIALQIGLKRFLYWKNNTCIIKASAASKIVNFMEHIIHGTKIIKLKIGLALIKKIIEDNNNKELIKSIIKKCELRNNQSLRDKFIRWSLKKKVILSNLIGKRDIFRLKQAFNQLKTKNSPALISSIRIKEGVSLIRQSMLKVNKMNFQVLYTFVSSPFQTKVLKQTLFNHSNKYIRKQVAHYFNLWRLQNKRKEFNDYRKQTNLKSHIKKKTQKNQKAVSEYFNKWSIICQINKSSVYGQSLYSTIINKQEYLVKPVMIRNITLRPSFNKWKRISILLSLHFKRQIYLKKLIKNNHLNSLKSLFEIWKKIHQKTELQQCKLKYLHLLISKNNTSNKIKFLIGYFKSWQKNRSLKQNCLMNSISYSVILMKSYLQRKVFCILKFALCNQLRKEKLNSVFKLLIAHSFRKWKPCLKTKEKKLNELNSFSNYITTNFNIIHQIINKSYIDQLKVILTETQSLIKSKAHVIQNYFKEITFIKHQNAILNQNIIIRNLIENLINKNCLKLKMYFTHFKKNVTQISISQSAQRIQRYYKRICNSKNKFQTPLKLLENYCQQTLNNHFKLFLSKCHPMQFKITQLKTIISNRVAILNNQTLLCYYNIWKKRLGRMNQNEISFVNKPSVEVYNQRNNVIPQTHKWLKTRVLRLSNQSKNKNEIKNWFIKWRNTIDSINFDQTTKPMQQFCKNKKEQNNVENQPNDNVLNFDKETITLSNTSTRITKENIIDKQIKRLSIICYNIKKISFRKWCNNAKRIMFYNYASLIQHFLKPKIAKLNHSKPINQLLTISKLHLYRRLLLVAKINRLKSLVKTQIANTLFKRIDHNNVQSDKINQNKCNRDKNLNKLISAFSSKWDQKYVYYLIRWKRNALELYYNEQALIIQLFLSKRNSNTKPKTTMQKVLNNYQQTQIQFNINSISPSPNTPIDLVNTNDLCKNIALLLNWFHKWKGNDTKPSQNKIKTLFKEVLLRKLLSILKKIGQRRRLYCLINITMRNTTRAMLKKIKYIIVMWNVYTGLMKIQKGQIKTMERNYNETYNILSDQLFGQGVNPNPSVLEEINALYNLMN